MTGPDEEDRFETAPMSACDTFSWCDASQHDATAPAHEQVHSLPEERVEWLAARPLYEGSGTDPYLYVDANLSGVRLTNPDEIRSFRGDLERMVRLVDEEADRLDGLAAAVRSEQ